MKYESLTVLIPSHSIEDLPLELPEQQAEGLLNAFAVIWHPLLLDSAGVKPNWERADSPPEEVRDRLFVVPAVSEDWVPCQWIEVARQRGAHIVQGVAERGAMIEQVLAPLETTAIIDTDLVGDFLALGHCQLQLEILTRQMRYFSEIDAARMQTEVVSAARAAVAGDRAAAESHLRVCFEMLLEGRERFYPVECYLADLCLLTPETADENWTELVRSKHAVNFLMTAEDLNSIAEQHPDELALLRNCWRDGEQEILGGEWTDTCSALLPLESALPSFHKGLRALERLCGRRPTVWLRRRYGVGIQVPQLLDKLGYTAGLHFVMDDGLYPDEEQGRHRWEGCDGSAVDSVSRIPLAADSASAMLRFPQRMAESMDYDQAALLVLARWPKLQTPWLDDLRHMEKYTPVLGRFVTFSDFFRSTDTPARLSRHKAGDYLSPHLVAAVAREQADPVSRYADHWSRHHRSEAVMWMAGMAELLRGRPFDVARFEAWEQDFDANAPATDELTVERHEQILEAANVEYSRNLASVVVGGRGTTTGCFIANPCSFGRRAAITWPLEVPSPRSSPAIIARQRDQETETLVVELPPSGFLWLPAGGAPPVQAVKSTRIPMAEENALRNEQFDVRISDVTGGISQVKTYRRGPNRISQQLAFRFPRECTVISGEGDERFEEKTWYSEMRVLSSEVLSEGPARAEVETTGVLVDPTNESMIARFVQRTRVWMGLPFVEIELELQPERLPEGDPWSNYFAVRWAWNDAKAALTYSVHEGAHSVTSDRFEAPHFVELADEGQRTTIHPLGCLFHRKTGPRMLDTLLITAGETRRRFRFVVSVDSAFPMEPSRDVFQPVTPVPLLNGPEASTSGWFFHLDSRNVQITALMPLPSVVEGGHAQEAVLNAEPCRSVGVKLRLRETEGRPCAAKLRCFRPPANARQVDFLDRPITDLTIEGDTITIGLTAYEICDVCLHFV